MPTNLSYLTQAITLVEIEIELLHLTYKNHYLSGDKTHKQDFIWTGKVVDLVEMIYAICEDSNINGGNVVMTHFVAYVGELLSIDVKDFSSMYRDIKYRKSANTSRTYFLDKLVVKLNQRMDREDSK